MPAYFYHLVFELGLHSNPQPDQSQPFVPPANLNLFTASLPVNRIATWTSYLAPRAHRRSKTGLIGERPQLPGRARSASGVYLNKSNDKDSNTVSRTAHIGALKSTPASSIPAGKEAFSVPDVGIDDYRLDKLCVESINMEDLTTSALESRQIAEAKAATLESAALHTPDLRGKYVPSESKATDLGWGVVHLYRDNQDLSEVEANSRSASDEVVEGSSESYVDNECTTLCILAVPSYMTPSDLLGWIGSETQEQVSHFRLVKTSRSNRYMVLLKFRKSEEARNWQRNSNGKLFNITEPENCHIVFVKSIRFHTRSTERGSASFPDVTNDPFAPVDRSIKTDPDHPAPDDSYAQSASSLSSKPAPPPTAALVELPTCPVCLERMDDTTGLATIFCQHVFHCGCLQKWQGSGCPVCRYTQEDPLHRWKSHRHDIDEEQCKVCGSTKNLWICLICGQIGCGRYNEAHAYAHFEQSSHSFAMDLETQVIWDYVGDEYVHRLIQNKADGRLLELPSAANGKGQALGDQNLVSDKAKMENMSLEYASLLKGQLDSQRSYFEEQIDRAADKASEASLASDKATAACLKATERLESMQTSHQILLNETLPELEKEKERVKQRAERFETMARKMEKEWKEKDVINESLMDRIAHLEKQVNEMTMKNSDLEEQNRDLSFFISGMEKLKDQGSDVQEGTVSVADAPATGKKKKKKGKDKTVQA